MARSNKSKRKGNKRRTEKSASSPVESVQEEQHVEQETRVEIPEDAVEVHWITASAGSVIQIPGGRGAQFIQFQDQDGRIVELPICEDDPDDKVSSVASNSRPCVQFLCFFSGRG